MFRRGRQRVVIRRLYWRRKKDPAKKKKRKEKKNKIIELKFLATAGFESKGEYNDKKQSR